MSLKVQQGKEGMLYNHFLIKMTVWKDIETHISQLSWKEFINIVEKYVQAMKGTPGIEPLDAFEKKKKVILDLRSSITTRYQNKINMGE